MGFQKCPVCSGTGFTDSMPGLNAGPIQCPTCNGHRIISEITGLPPSYNPFPIKEMEEHKEELQTDTEKPESLMDKLKRTGSIWNTEPKQPGEPGNLPFNTEVHNDMFRVMKKFKENNIKMWEMEHDGTFARKHSTHTSSDGLTPVEIELVHKTGFTWMGKCEKLPGVVIYRNSKLRAIDDLELKLKTKGYKIGSITVIKD